ncbi:MAG: hypothetical protein QG549_870 [Patescibacteria group bacterium]|nr:hypothetical protein [Patescibacteria group bacterium]
MTKVLKDYETEVLEYMYRHKIENGIDEFVVTELPNQKSFNTLAREGLIYLNNSDSSMIKVRITSKGLDYMSRYSMTDRQKILKYYYDNRTQKSIFTGGLDQTLSIEHPVLLSEANYLVGKGYLEKVGKGAMSGDNFLKITATGVDLIESPDAVSKSTRDLSTISETSTASITNDVISMKIRQEIYSHISSFIDSRHYYTAVEESYKVVREKLKEITTEEAASAVFGENALNEKYWGDIFGEVPEKGTPEHDFMRGTGYMHMAVQYLRNEKSHTKAAEIDKNLALHYISLASLAYDLISRRNSAV